MPLFIELSEESAWPRNTVITEETVMVHAGARNFPLTRSGAVRLRDLLNEIKFEQESAKINGIVEKLWNILRNDMPALPVYAEATEEQHDLARTFYVMGFSDRADLAASHCVAFNAIFKS
jgi:hypothetical protein